MSQDSTVLAYLQSGQPLTPAQAADMWRILALALLLDLLGIK